MSPRARSPVARPRFSPEERRQAILVAARKVFAQQGFAAARTKDIAARADVAEGLIFSRFKTKEALFEAAILDPLDDLVQRVGDAAAAFARSSAAEDRTARALEFHTEILETMTEIGPLLGAVLSDQGDVARSFYNRRIVPTIDRIGDALALSLRNTPGAAVDPMLLAKVIWGSHYFLAVDAGYRGVALDVDEQVKEITRLLASALGLRDRRAPARGRG